MSSEPTPEDPYFLLDPDAFRQFIDQTEDRSYLLLDLRDPADFRRERIPGAQSLPFAELEKRLGDLPRDLPLLLYDVGGWRSRAAALLLGEQGFTQERLVVLDGGFDAWSGNRASRLPRLAALPPLRTVSEMLLRAFEMEKGSHLFYQGLAELPIGRAMAPDLVKLSGDEAGHARAIYGVLVTIDSHETFPSFDELFAGAKTDLLEGGLPLSAALKAAESLQVMDFVELADFALAVEFGGYELYRSLAERVRGNPDAEDAVYRLVEREKQHIRFWSASTMEEAELEDEDEG